MQISSRNWSHVHGNFLKSRGFYRFFLNRNVIPFYFHFIQRMLSHHTLLLKACVVQGEKIMNFQDFFFTANFIVSKTLIVIPWISQSFKINSITGSFWGSRWLIHPEGLRNFLYSFWKQPTASFFKNTNYCFPDQGNVGHHTKLTYSWNTFLCGF